MRVHVVTFATKEYLSAANLLKLTAFDKGAVKVFIYTPDSPCLVDLYSASISSKKGLLGTPGYNFYSWKARIILDALKRPDILDGDVVIYADSTMMFETSFTEWVRMVTSSSFVSTGVPKYSIQLFRLMQKEHTLENWTCSTVLKQLGVSDDAQMIHRRMLNAAIQVYYKGVDAIDFVNKYDELCTTPALIKGAGQALRAHRHDQSLLSYLAYSDSYKSKVYIDDDITQWGPLGMENMHIHHHRNILPAPIIIGIITPTRGSAFLREAICSVQNQTIARTTPNVIVQHWVVVDGPECCHKVNTILEEFNGGRVEMKKVVLPHQTGGDKWNGHNVYGGLVWLMPDTHLVCFLDEDNAYETDHIHGLLTELLEKKKDWAFSFRQLMDEKGSFVGYDRCESLGNVRHTVLAEDDYLVDTNCYMVRRELAKSHCMAWNVIARPDNGQKEADRAFVSSLLAAGNKPAVSRRYSLRYRVSSTPSSVTKDFFYKGNAISGFDPAKKDVYVFHFSKEATAAMLSKMQRRGERSFALDEWQPTLWSGLLDTYNLLDGFTNTLYMPDDAIILVALCHPSTLPLEFLKKRKAENKGGTIICYTAESPNIRHQQQWTRNFLSEYFNIILTYYKPILEVPPLNCQVYYAPHNCHHLNLNCPLDRGLLRCHEEDSNDKKVNCCIILERRSYSGTYQIDEQILQSLDYLREKYVRVISTQLHVDCYGLGWDKMICKPATVTVKECVHRSKDPRSSVDILYEYDVAIIIENCSAPGYCSEKMYDALIAGTVPLYYGDADHNIVPKDAYIDLKTLDGDQLTSLLVRLADPSTGLLKQYKKRIVEVRESLLRKVDVHTFAQGVDQAIASNK